MPKLQKLPKPSRLRREISTALAIKFALLAGLWWLQFRWQTPPDTQPDIATHLALPVDNVVSSQSLP